MKLHLFLLLVLSMMEAKNPLCQSPLSDVVLSLEFCQREKICRGKSGIRIQSKSSAEERSETEPRSEEVSVSE